jgi:putative membrane protein
MQEMIKDHKEDVAEFQKQSNSAADPDVKAFAAETLPTLKQHLHAAEDSGARAR